MSEKTHWVVRFACLVVVPTALASLPWVLYLHPESLPDLSFLVVAAVQLLGLVPLLGYRWLTRERAELLPYVPAAAISVFFCALTVEDLASAMFDEPGSEYLLMVLVPGLALLQPVLALFGAVISFVSINGRTRPEPASR